MCPRWPRRFDVKRFGCLGLQAPIKVSYKGKGPDFRPARVGCARGGHPAGWAGRIRTCGMRESKTRALPLGYGPIKTKKKDQAKRTCSLSPDPVFFNLGWIERFELSASRATIWRANQLRYTHHVFGALGGTRTPGLLLRRQLLYPAELLARVRCRCNGRMERVMGIEPT